VSSILAQCHADNLKIISPKKQAKEDKKMNTRKQKRLQKFIDDTLQNNFDYKNRWRGDEFSFTYKPKLGVEIQLVAGFEIDEHGGDMLDYLGEFITRSKRHSAFNIRDSIYVARAGEDIKELGYLMKNDSLYDERNAAIFDGYNLVGVIDRVYEMGWCEFYSNFQHTTKDWDNVSDKDINTAWLRAKMDGEFGKYAISHDNTKRNEKIKSLIYLYCCQDFERHIKYGDDYEIMTAYCKAIGVNIGEGVKVTGDIDTNNLLGYVGGIESDCNVSCAREALNNVIYEVVSKV